MQQSPILVVLVLAVVASVIIVVSGHATDGASLLTCLFTLIGGLSGGHLAALIPGANQGNAPAGAAPAPSAASQPN